MNTVINITVRDRVPYIGEGEGVISQNSDYAIAFDFDDEWKEGTKTVYFAFEDSTYKAAVMEGTSCVVPIMDGGHKRVFVGVQEGELKTTRPCCLKILDSIADYIGEGVPDPSEDVYQQIMKLLNSFTAPSWDTLTGKPFTSLGEGLTVTDGVLSAEGGGTSDAVQYVEQSLTDEQKAQARANIGAGTSSFSGSYTDLSNKPTIPTQVTIDSTLKQSGKAADAKAVGDALSGKQNAGNYLTAESDPTVPSWAKQATKPTYTASEVGALPDTTVIPSAVTKTSQLTNDSGFLTLDTLPKYGGETA